jgi:ribosomal protein S18 acetylase RimI-like enzyme
VPARQTPVRLARVDDARWVAELHAESWRRNYRGSYADSYLDGDLLGERLGVWRTRLSRPDVDSVTLIAEQGERRAGFLHVRLDADPVWGALIDNLHVCHDLQRTGIGTLLMVEAGALVARLRPGSGVYLWVQEQNKSARSFYQSCGGSVRGREPVSPPAGDARNLSGSPTKLRIAWSSPSLVTRL